MRAVDRQYARLLCAALPALERLELGLDMQTVHWQELEQLRHLSQAMWDDEFGGWEAGQPSPERLHQPAEAFEFLGGSDGGARAPWVRHCIGAQREILPALRLGPAPRHAEMGWLDLWLNLEYTRQLG